MRNADVCGLAIAQALQLLREHLKRDLHATCCGLQLHGLARLLVGLHKGDVVEQRVLRGVDRIVVRSAHRVVECGHVGVVAVFVLVRRRLGNGADLQGCVLGQGIRVVRRRRYDQVVVLKAICLLRRRCLGIRRIVFARRFFSFGSLTRGFPTSLR